jgi:hypothetical protein
MIESEEIAKILSIGKIYTIDLNSLHLSQIYFCKVGTFTYFSLI